MMPIGAIADDVTGAVDLATTLVGSGYRTRLLVGAEAADHIGDADAVVIALKSRTAPVAEAVAASGAALDLLLAAGAEQIYVKYCSTFDSTPEGNIGPVCDLVADRVGARASVVVPSFPANGRTVYAGHLFVDGTLLAESSMAEHPLTPMRDSHVVRLLAAQTSQHVGLIDLPIVRAGAAAVRRELDAHAAAGDRYVVVDAIDDDDLRTIAAATAGDAMVTGGSGLGLGMVGPRPGSARAQVPEQVHGGRRLVLVGSASAATGRQREAAAKVGLPFLTIDPARAQDAVPDAVQFARQAWEQDPNAPVVIAPQIIEDPDVRRSLAAGLEATMAMLARELVRHGARQLLVAGGETSGAVVQALGARDLRVGASLGPGLAWTYAETTAHGPLALALKSGNFGTDTLFIDAWEALV